MPSQQTIPVPPKRASGCGCFATGCLTLFVIAFLGLLAVVGVAWYSFGKALDLFTSPQPVNVALEMPSEEQFTAADAKLTQLRDALSNNQAATISFSADELNALIARHPDFASRRDKMRVAIADSIATVDMSAPLRTLRWSGIKHRWFNGSASFTFIYAQEGFALDLKWIEANGHRISTQSIGWITSLFSRSLGSGFERAVRDHGDRPDFWRDVKTMTLDRDQLVIMTKGAEAL